MFKQHVGLYHHRVRQRVREANHIAAQLRRYGVFVRESAFADAESRPKLLDRLPDNSIVRSNLSLLWKGYDVVAEQVAQMRRSLVGLARRHETIRRFVQLPGIQWVRSATFFAYVDTPWRFRSKSALWKYLGIGLERWHSGNSPARIRVSHNANRLLKYVILGAAQAAVAQGDNPFADQYHRWTVQEGMSLRNARRNVARSLAAVMWGMWKNGSEYRPDWVCERT